MRKKRLEGGRRQRIERGGKGWNLTTASLREGHRGGRATQWIIFGKCLCRRSGIYASQRWSRSNRASNHGPSSVIHPEIDNLGSRPMVNLLCLVTLMCWIERISLFPSIVIPSFLARRHVLDWGNKTIVPLHGWFQNPTLKPNGRVVRFRRKITNPPLPLRTNSILVMRRLRKLIFQWIFHQQHRLGKYHETRCILRDLQRSWKRLLWNSDQELPKNFSQEDYLIQNCTILHGWIQRILRWKILYLRDPKSIDGSSYPNQMLRILILKRNMNIYILG